MSRPKRKATSPPALSHGSDENDDPAACAMSGCTREPQKADVYGLRFCLVHGVRVCATPMCTRYVDSAPVADTAAAAASSSSSSSPVSDGLTHDVGNCSDVCRLLGCTSPTARLESKTDIRPTSAPRTSVRCTRCLSLIETGHRASLVLVLGNFDAQDEKSHTPGSVVNVVPTRAATGASELASLRKQIRVFQEIRRGGGGGKSSKKRGVKKPKSAAAAT